MGIVREGSGGISGQNEHTIHHFANGQGASVIRGQFTYGGDRGLWEIAVAHFPGESPEWHIDYDTPITDDVLGHLTDAEVQETLAAIEALPRKRPEDCSVCRESVTPSEGVADA